MWRRVFAAIWRGAGKVARRLIDEEQSVKEIADTFNVHTAAIYRLSKTAAYVRFLFRCSPAPIITNCGQPATRSSRCDVPR
jgi:hypothetical protein